MTMRINIIRYTFLLFLTICCANLLSAQQEFLYGDQLPDAPELSARGEHTVGVRTVQLVHKDQVDILNSKAGEEPLYDRPLTIELWYPAKVAEGAIAEVTYEEVMGTRGDSLRPLIPFTFKGRALRDATAAAGKFPLLIVSHGYVGSRYLMTYLTENLASKGYVVAAIDHTDSTFKDANAFQSTLLNRAQDVKFVINEMARLGASNSGDAMAGHIDADSSAISKLLASNESYKKQDDPRIKAVVAFAPWGMARGVWDAEGLKGLNKPTFFVAGSQDDISGYENGIKAIYDGAINTDRYLLTYKDARHNVAPNPPPAESLDLSLSIDEYYRYADSTWDQRKINNVNQHFVTAFLGIHLKGEDHLKFLAIPENSNDQNWPGFKPRSSTGMELLKAQKVK